MTTVSNEIAKTLTQCFNQITLDEKYKLVLFGDQEVIKSNLTSGQQIVIVESQSINSVVQALQESQNQALLTFSNPKLFYKVLSKQEYPKLAHTTLFKKDDKSIMFLDSGVNPEPDVDTLFHFSSLASIYMKNTLSILTPRIAVLSNGEEEGKGTQLIRDIGQRLQDSELNYMGNIEPSEIIAGKTDIIITDGYTGDIFLKTFVPAMRYLLKLIRDEHSSNMLTQVGEYVASAGLARTDQKINAFQNLGGPILGYNNLVFWSPPDSDVNLIQNALNNLQYSANMAFVK